VNVHPRGKALVVANSEDGMNAEVDSMNHYEGEAKPDQQD
jgi:hypothetical protein